MYNQWILFIITWKKLAMGQNYSLEEINLLTKPNKKNSHIEK